ncbi:hybrid sensor histidine kinase/response regulator [Zavarzinia aquatilis]|uniref:histidine kinase n=1 Tax=Zavarzinia aquatilis TaxID=2211142 RepID=A0A317E118_9PROT|nr:ATP-binding protein [Zavarzinia aquatilis]PWR20134.1 hypothetical protein DKG74_15720 [Zavarzinia aquatilis]
MFRPRRGRIIWAATALLAALYVCAALYVVEQVNRAGDHIEHGVRAGGWALSELIRDYDGLTIASYRADSERSPAAYDDMQRHLGVLRNRIDRLGADETAAGLRAVDGVVPTLNALGTALAALHRRLGTTAIGELATPAETPTLIRRTLAPFEDSLRDLQRKILLSDEGAAEHRELGQAAAHLGLLLGGMFALGLAIVGLAIGQAWRTRVLKREAQAAQAQTQRLKLAIGNSSDGIALTDGDGCFTQMNDAHLKMFGIASPGAIVGRHWSALYGPAEAERLQNDMIPALRRDHRWHGLAIGLTAAGTPVEQEISLTLLDDGGILCITRDVTTSRVEQRARRLLEEQLLVAQKMEAVGRLTSGFAHDFNNVLASIQGYAEILRDDAPEASPPRRFSEQILTATKRGRGLVERILGFGRPARDHVESCDLGAAVEEAIGLLSGALPPSIALTSEGAVPGVVVALSSDQAMQVLMNLGVNAKDALGEHQGTIRIAIGEAPLPPGWPHVLIGRRRTGTDCACLRVEDSGEGVAEDQLVRIFEPFFTTKAEGSGTGLGLAAVHSIVTGCGGEIVLASKIGQGTRFDLYLPLSTPDLPPAEADTDPAVPRQKLRVLIAEDDELLSEALGEALERQGFTVHVVHDARSALAYLARHSGQIDVLLTDEAMPGMRGSEMIRQLRSAGSRLPIVLWSANADPTLLGAAGLLGANSRVEFCRKPASTGDLIAAINRAVAAP